MSNEDHARPERGPRAWRELALFTRLRRSPADDAPAAAPTDEAPTDEAPAADASAGNAADDPALERRGRGRRVAAWVTTALACALVLFALIAPNELARLTPGAFVRIPLEGLVVVAVVLVLPVRARQVVAAVVGVILGLLAVVKILDMGFFSVFARPFDPVLDWTFFGAGVEYLTQSVGRAGAIGSVVAAVVLIVAVLVLMTLSVRRLTRLVARHHGAAIRAVAVLGVAWVTCAALGAQLVPGVPVAAQSYDRVLEMREGLGDEEVFATEAAVDAFRDTPGGELLTGLRGKDVVLAFVESYGRDAVEDPEYAPRVGAVLDDGTRRLRAAGYASRSAFLSSPTSGGGSWLAHGTLLSGLWVDNQQRYQKLVKSDRLTLTGAFGRAGWRTVGVMPGITRAWPEGAFFGYDRVYDRWSSGYRGPRFNWGMPPDQFTLSAFERYERDKRDRTPVMAEIPLVSSHAPWAPTPRLVDWKAVGDGRIFEPQAAAGARPDDVWRDPAQVRAAYRGSIEYSLSTLISYVETQGDDDLVLVFLGDHQPAPIITGAGAGRDVPITIVARDRTVMDRISEWGWHDGLKPGAQAPVWRMNSFRDRFLTAFGPQAR